MLTTGQARVRTCSDSQYPFVSGMTEIYYMENIQHYYITKHALIKRQPGVATHTSQIFRVQQSSQVSNLYFQDCYFSQPWSSWLIINNLRGEFRDLRLLIRLDGSLQAVWSYTHFLRSYCFSILLLPIYIPLPRPRNPQTIIHDLEVIHCDSCHGTRCTTRVRYPKDLLISKQVKYQEESLEAPQRDQP